jgi:orotidine-5'-phosphate decarboxylase
MSAIIDTSGPIHDSRATRREDAMTQSDDRLIVGLDLPHAPAALELVEALGDAVGFYKVGLGMLTSGGLALANELKGQGKRVFLDLKLFDISATVEAAVRGLGQFGLDFLTVHGDPHVVRAAVAGRGAAPTRILAVTILTSLDRDDLDEALIREGSIPHLVTERARRAFLAGADGVIASPREAAVIRALPEAEGRLIITPGVRPEGAAPGDQKRVASPTDALRAGADHLVIARPILAAPDPRASVLAILEEIRAV